jgi:anti-sigma regulatory factor (Ser/Thr protein kinase)
VKIHIPGRAYLNDFERFVRNIEDDGSDDFTLVVPPHLFSLHPLATSMIASEAIAARSRGVNVLVEGLASTASTRYLERMGLFGLMGVESGIAVTAHEPAGRFVPLRRIQTNDELNDFVVDMVPLLHAEPGEAAAVKYVLYELVRNVLEHARTTDGAVVSAQVVPRDGRLLIGVADSGIGLRASLARSHPVTSERNAMRLAFRPGVTGVTRRLGGDETNGGAGLFFMKAIALVAQNYLVAISGATMFKLLTNRPAPTIIAGDIQDDRATWGKLDCPWQGTAVGIDLAVTDDRTFSDLLGVIRGVYGVDVRGRRKELQRARFGSIRRGTP